MSNLTIPYVLPYLTLPYLTLPYHMSYLILLYLTLCLTLSYLTITYHTIPYLMSYLTLPYVLPYLTFCLTLPYVLPYLTLCLEWLFRFHAFIFLCTTTPWVKYPQDWIFFFNFERILYWYEMKAYILKNLFLNYFFYLTIYGKKCWTFSSVQHCRNSDPSSKLCYLCCICGISEALEANGATFALALWNGFAPPSFRWIPHHRASLHNRSSLGVKYFNNIKLTTAKRFDIGSLVVSRSLARIPFLLRDKK